MEEETAPSIRRRSKGSRTGTLDAVQADMLYSKNKIDPISKFSPRSAWFQNILVGFVCFACPGMFNALNGLGGSGLPQEYAHNAQIATGLLYAFFAIFGFFAGAFLNLLGPKLLLFVGGLTYAYYAGTVLWMQLAANVGALYSGGILLGIGAALLWTAQGSIMMSYPTEEKKGAYIANFWIIFNLGGVIGGLIPFFLNLNSEQAGISTVTYIVFIVIMALGACISLFLTNPNNVIKEDGTSVVMTKSTNVGGEILEIFKLFANKHLMLLATLFFTSNFFYSYQFAMNGFLFNVRTRALNSALYWLSQMFASYITGNFLLDNNKIGDRNKRAKVGLLTVLIVGCVSWGLGWVVQLEFSQQDVPPNIDFTDSAHAAFPIIVFLLYAFFDSILQSYSYWVMGSLSNDSAFLARAAGFYKGIQSAGGAVSWLIAPYVPMMGQLLLNWGLMLIALIPAWFAVKEVSEKPLYGSSPAPVYSLGQTSATIDAQQVQAEAIALGSLPYRKFDQNNTPIVEVAQPLKSSQAPPKKCCRWLGWPACLGITFATIAGFALLLFIGIVSFSILFINDASVPSTLSLVAPTDTNVLMTVFPHPDDDVTSAGTLGFQTRYGKTVVDAIFYTCGDAAKTRPPGTTDEQLCAIRSQETKDAAKIEGVSNVVIYNYGDGQLMNRSRTEMEQVLLDAINKYKPSTIVTYDPEIGLYGHPDHQAVSQFALAVYDQNKDDPNFPVKRVWAVTLPDHQIMIAKMFSSTFANRFPADGSKNLPKPTVGVRISPAWDVKGSVVRAYKSQAAVLNDVQPFYASVSPWLYYRIQCYEYYALMRGK